MALKLDHALVEERDHIQCMKALVRDVIIVILPRPLHRHPTQVATYLWLWLLRTGMCHILLYGRIMVIG